MRRAFPTFVSCCALAVVLAACAGPRRAPAPAAVDVASDPYSAFPGPPAPPRDVRPLTARVTHRGVIPADLTAFLDRLTAAVESGNWRAVALFLEESALREQLLLLTAAGLSPARAGAETLAGALGLDDAGHPLLPPTADRDAAPFAGLDRVGTITVESVVPRGAGVSRVDGYVRLDDRSTPTFSFEVIAAPRGPRVVVPQG